MRKALILAALIGMAASPCLAQGGPQIVVLHLEGPQAVVRHWTPTDGQVAAAVQALRIYLAKPGAVVGPGVQPPQVAADLLARLDRFTLQLYGLGVQDVIQITGYCDADAAKQAELAIHLPPLSRVPGCYFTAGYDTVSGAFRSFNAGIPRASSPTQDPIPNPPIQANDGTPMVIAKQAVQDFATAGVWTPSPAEAQKAQTALKLYLAGPGTAWAGYDSTAVHAVVGARLTSYTLQMAGVRQVLNNVGYWTNDDGARLILVSGLCPAGLDSLSRVDFRGIVQVTGGGGPAPPPGKGLCYFKALYDPAVDRVRSFGVMGPVPADPADTSPNPVLADLVIHPDDRTNDLQPSWIPSDQQIAKAHAALAAYLASPGFQSGYGHMAPPQGLSSVQLTFTGIQWPAQGPTIRIQGGAFSASFDPEKEAITSYQTGVR